MNIKPLSDRVVVKPLEQDEVKQGSIIIPDTAKEKPMQGEVVAVGPGKVSDSGAAVAMEVKKAPPAAPFHPMPPLFLKWNSWELSHHRQHQPPPHRLSP